MEPNMEQALARGRQLINRLELIQFQYFNGRPQWTVIRFEDLKLFMAYTYYGSPFSTNEIGTELVAETNEREYTRDDIFECYKDEEKKSITDMIVKIRENIIKNNVDEINVGFTITHSICEMKCDLCQNFPTNDIHQWYLLRVKTHQDVAYIDLFNGRTYKNWSDYIENNLLPKGYMFFPRSGYYEESTYLTQHVTPQSSKSVKVLNSIDLMGRAASFGSCILVGCGLIFPIMAPVLIPAAATTGCCSAWECVRQVSKLKDLSSHSESLLNEKARNYWMNMVIATLGVITAPMSATVRTLELSNSAVMASNFGKSLSFIQKGACITQCSLEVIRFTANFIKNKKSMTLNDVMGFRLDVFVVTGSLLPLRFVVEFFQCIIGGLSLSSINNTLMNVPFCINTYIFKAVCFVQKHFAELYNLVVKFLKDELTPSKLIIGLKRFTDFISSYKNQLAEMNSSELLSHIVNNSGVLSNNESEEVKTILCGPTMKVLLQEKFPDKVSNQHFLKFLVAHIMEEAWVLHTKFNDILAECENHGHYNIDDIKREFCQVYCLNDCCMKYYVFHSIQKTSDTVNDILEAYNQYCALPGNQLNELLVANHQERSCTINTYATAPVGDILDETTCLRFAQTINPTSQEYRNYSFVQPEPDVSVLFSISSFSIKIVIFTSTMSNGIPSLNISFFHDLQGFTNNRLQ